MTFEFCRTRGFRLCGSSRSLRIRFCCLLLVCIGAVCTLGCERGGSEVVEAEVVPLSEAVVWLDTIRLEESDAVINVTPRVSLDPRGGFLVADPDEAQIRRYSTTGALIWYAGGYGAGPGELDEPTAAVRLPSGRILVTNRGLRFTIFNATADSVIRTVRTRFTQVEGVEVISDSLLLVSAKIGAGIYGPRLHVWSVASDTVVRSFFPPPADYGRTAVIVAGFPRADVRGDTVAAVFSLSDTVYIYTVAGEKIGKIPLPSRTFRRLDSPPPGSGADPGERMAWLHSFDYVAGVHWLSNGGLLIPYFSFLPKSGLTRSWHLLGVTRSGRGMFEAENIPRLLEVDSRANRLYFIAPGSKVPNRWAVAKLRP